MIDVDTLRKLLRYEPETGKLYWRPRPPALCESAAVAKRFNRRYAHKEAFTYVTVWGYRQGSLFNRLYAAHRVAWALYTGRWPALEIDHINNNRTDNRIENLREATRSENSRNRPADKNSTSKYRGVSWHKRDRAWAARIGLASGRVASLGHFKSEIEAAKAVDAASIKHHGRFAKLNFPT